MSPVSSSGPKRPSARALSPEVQNKVNFVERQFKSVEAQAQLTQAREALGRIDERLVAFPKELAALRRRGFLHARPLHEKITQAAGQWRTAKPRLQKALTEESNKLKSPLLTARSRVGRVGSGRETDIKAAESAVADLNTKVDAADRLVRSFYDDVDSTLYQVAADLKRITWAMDSLSQAPQIQLNQMEGPLMAVETEWQRDGDEGPKGVLYLTNQRLLLEQKEEVVTKKRFGLFKAESEIVQELLLDINISDIASVEDSEKGGFLGVGKADILEITGTGASPVSRARFHLKGQDSEDWRDTIVRVQKGQLEADLLLDKGQEVAKARFPTQCPNCMANLPLAAKGAVRVVCEFCGTAVGPIEEEGS